jgi:hypothetical protein
VGGKGRLFVVTQDVLVDQEHTKDIPTRRLGARRRFDAVKASNLTCPPLAFLAVSQALSCERSRQLVLTVLVAMLRETSTAHHFRSSFVKLKALIVFWAFHWFVLVQADTVSGDTPTVSLCTVDGCHKLGAPH